MLNSPHLTLIEQDALPDSGVEDGEIILSLRDGAVWANWPDGRAAVQLGEHDSVVEMMRNFIRQSETAERLASRVCSGGLAN